MKLVGIFYSKFSELKYETKIFELTYPIQNLARFENRESQSSDVRECFKVPWFV